MNQRPDPNDPAVTEEAGRGLQDYRQRLILNARIPAHFRDYDFDTFPVSAATKPIVERVRTWLNYPEIEDEEERAAYWRDWRPGLFLFGPMGTGKTGLAIPALKHEIAQMDEPGRFYVVADLLAAARRRMDDDYREPAVKSWERWQTGAPEDPIEDARQIEVLVLDDLGAERPTEWAKEQIFSIINHRHGEDLTTIITSNYDLNELVKRVGERTCWRIAEMSEIVAVKGPNLRDRADPKVVRLHERMKGKRP